LALTYQTITPTAQGSMPLYLTASHSSRIRKPGAKTPPLRRSSSSAFSHLRRRKPGPQSKSVDIDSNVNVDDEAETFNGTGEAISLAAISPVDSVLHAIQHSHESMFCEIPARAGMNSTRIAEVLNFRKSLPLVVSLAHVHGMLTASTRTEREIASLIASGAIRKLTMSGRGNAISGLGEFLVLTQNLEAGIRASLLDSTSASR
jgi:Serine-threonine protein kinase 19